MLEVPRSYAIIVVTSEDYDMTPRGTVLTVDVTEVFILLEKKCKALKRNMWPNWLSLSDTCTNTPDNH